jgi:RNA-directed DNA polymerase
MSHLSLLISLPDTEESLDLLATALDFTEEEIALAKSLFSKELPPLVKPQCLPYLFGISHQLIGLMEKFPERFYRSFDIKKSGGGIRHIQAPRRFLKTIQRWILNNICLQGNLSENVFGFVKGRSIFGNARVHAKNRNLMVIDISDFFPSIKFAQVEAVFKSFGFPNRVAHQLAALCCLDGQLPQGAPTSPAIANLVFKPVDDQLTKLAMDWECDYSRYADDLAFSGSELFNNANKSAVVEILETFGFSINEKKSRIIGQGGRQVVSGLVVNSNVLPLRNTRRRWKATFHRASKHPEESVEKLTRLMGIASFVKQYSQETSAKYIEIVKKVSEFV